MIEFIYVAIMDMSGYATFVVIDKDKQNKEQVLVPLAVGIVIMIVFSGGYGALAGIGTAILTYGYSRTL